ncbi:MAG: hypothetical protein LBU18_02620 [Treponema sp.]|jgi:hypothetical protein|nr:hypothetical protein [Treponema sp.]
MKLTNKQTKQKRLFTSVFALALSLALAGGLAGCSYASAPAGSDAEAAQQAAAQQAAQTAAWAREGLTPVTIALPGGAASSVSRSLNPAFAEFDVDTYEAVFRTKGDIANTSAKAYYRGEASADSGFIKVGVYPGLTYDVLLLAGKGNVLLGAGLTPNQPIEAGKTNTVPITMQAITPQWDTGASTNNVIATSGANQNDFEFAVAGLDITGTNSGLGADNFTVTGTPTERAILVSPKLNTISPKIGLPRIIPASTTFTASFNLLKLKPLIEASPTDTTNYKLKFESQTVEILSFGDSGGGGFPYVTLKRDTDGTGVSGTDLEYNIVKSTIPDSIIISFTNDKTAGHGQLPELNVNGKLVFGLGYKAFSASAETALKTWTITNGLTKALDAPGATDADTNGSGLGGAFLIKFGEGAIETQAYGEINTSTHWN